MTRPILTAFERSPDRGQGLGRDMRVRWALEEVGRPYDVRLVPWEAMKAPEHRARQPFGQIPTWEEGALTLFESGAIVLRIAEAAAARGDFSLLPAEPDARSRAIMWMFCATGTMDPPIMELVVAKIVQRDRPWAAERLPLVEDRIHGRLAELSQALGEGEWLDGAFSAGDLMMVHVLQRLKPSGMLEAYPSLAAYVARGMARPAYQRAFAAQKAVYEASGGG